MKQGTAVKHPVKPLLLALIVAATLVVALATPGWAQESKQHRVIESLPDEIPPLQPLMHDGEPIFPIGAYKLPDGIDLAEVSKNGWTAVKWNHNPRQRRNWDAQTENEKYAAFLDRAAQHDVATMIFAQDLVLAGDREGYARRLDRLKDHEAFWGFYLVDEPENTWWNHEKRNDLKAYIREQGLDPEQENQIEHLFAAIRDRLSWATPLFHRLDDNSDDYTFACLAWTPQYSNLQPLVDVNMPNAYPKWWDRGASVAERQGAPLGGSLAEVVYDAKVAAASAASAGQGRGFIYTPLALDQRENWGPVPQEVVRYTFFAPVTQGAMGVIYWAGYRSTKAYAREVIFPVTREMSALKTFFLGQWLDDRLSWTPTDRNNPVLTKYNVPRVSAMLRRADDGRLLLLAVNNTAEPTEATFAMDLDRPGLPDAEEFFGGATVPTGQGAEGQWQIQDRLGPYAVKGYILGDGTGP